MSSDLVGRDLPFVQQPDDVGGHVAQAAASVVSSACCGMTRTALPRAISDRIANSSRNAVADGYRFVGALRLFEATDTVPLALASASARRGPDRSGR